METGASQGTEVTASASIIPGSGGTDTSSTLSKFCLKHSSMYNYKQKDISMYDVIMHPCKQNYIVIHMLCDTRTHA